MARLAGVDIPRDKRVVIALTYIYGIGRTRSVEILKATEIDESIRVKDLSDEQLVALLNAMQPQRYYTTAELMQLLGLVHRESFRKTYLKPALAQGLVAMLIPEKPNSPKQKYRKV